MSHWLRCLVVVVAAAGAGGCWFPDDSPRISIEFGMYPEMFEGLDVRIDGEVAGKLVKTGQATRVSFPVTPGMHEVTVDHPEIECQPRRVDAQLRGQKVRLMLELEERASTDGSLAQWIVFR